MHPDIGELRRECQRVHAARELTASWGCAGVSPHRVDLMAVTAHVDGDALCACPMCDDARRERVREAAKTILARHALQSVSGIRSIPSNDQDDSVNTVVQLNAGGV